MELYTYIILFYCLFLDRSGFSLAEFNITKGTYSSETSQTNQITTVQQILSDKSFMMDVTTEYLNETSTVNGVKTSETSTVNGVKTSETPTVNGVKTSETPTVNGVKTSETSTVNGVKTSEKSTVNGVKTSETSTVNGVKTSETSTVNGVKHSLTSLTTTNLKNKQNTEEISNLSNTILPVDDIDRTTSGKITNMSITLLPVGDDDDDDEDDDNENNPTTTANPTTVTNFGSSRTTENSSPVTSDNIDKTGSQSSTTESTSVRIVGTQPLDANDDSGFVVILIVVCSVSGVFVVIAVVVIVHVQHKRRSNMKEKPKQRHNSIPMERQRSFSNPAYLEHDIDILASGFNSSPGALRGDNFYKPPKGDNYFETANNYDEIRENRLSRQSAYVSVIENADLNYQEIGITDEKTAKNNRKSIVSSAYDFLRFKGFKSFGKSDRTKIVENEVSQDRDSRSNEYHTLGLSSSENKKTDENEKSLYDHVPNNKSNPSAIGANYDHVVPSASTNENQDTDNSVENYKYQYMFPPINREVDMYNQCPVISNEPRTSL